jgi:hypothetical protein
MEISIRKITNFRLAVAREEIVKSQKSSIVINLNIRAAPALTMSIHGLSLGGKQKTLSVF